MSEQQQERWTYEDCKKAQDALIELFERKLKQPVLTYQEHTQYKHLLSDALMSSAVDSTPATRPKAPRLEFKDFALTLGRNAHHFGLLMMEYSQKAVNGKITFLRKYYDIDNRKIVIQRVPVDLRVLWKKLYDECCELFPTALSIAMKSSKEIPKKSASDGYRFSEESK